MLEAAARRDLRRAQEQLCEATRLACAAVLGPDGVRVDARIE